MLLVTQLVGCLVFAVYTTAVPLRIVFKGAIKNTTPRMIMNASDCNACVCAMFASSNNSTILALNCFSNYSSGVLCQLFTNATSLTSNTTDIGINVNSTLYLRQLSTTDQSRQTTAASVTVSSTTGTTGTTICSTPSTTTAVTVNPLPAQCFNYTLITDGTRNVASTQSGGCDNATFPATPIWIRFSGAAGTMIANCAIQPYHCGANSAGWYTGLYPTTGGETTNGTVCYTWTGGATCIYSNSISITNCNNYYVFALVRPTTCSLRYCTL